MVIRLGPGGMLSARPQPYHHPFATARRSICGFNGSARSPGMERHSYLTWQPLEYPKAHGACPAPRNDRRLERPDWGMYDDSAHGNGRIAVVLAAAELPAGRGGGSYANAVSYCADSAVMGAIIGAGRNIRMRPRVDATGCVHADGSSIGGTSVAVLGAHPHS